MRITTRRDKTKGGNLATAVNTGRPSDSAPNLFMMTSPSSARLFEE
jgi:hypothetical protein